MSFMKKLSVSKRIPIYISRFVILVSDLFVFTTKLYFLEAYTLIMLL